MKPALVPVPREKTEKAICITCKEPVSNVYGRIGHNHQTCSKKCSEAYEKLSVNEKMKARAEVVSVAFQAPDPKPEGTFLKGEGMHKEPGLKLQDQSHRRKL